MAKQKKDGLTRRGLLGLAGSATVLSATVGASRLLGQGSSDVTPPQTEGPFFPKDTSTESDADLTRLGQSPIAAEGRRVRINGLVLGKDGNPLQGAAVTLWQACHTGKYNHPSDPNKAALDPHFQYWAALETTDEGEFSALTVEPGAYPATSNWDRPPHVHFRVEHGGTKLTTQMYFKGNHLNKNDKLLVDTRRDFGDEAADSLIVEFKKGPDGVAEGLFVIRLGTTVALD